MRTIRYILCAVVAVGMLAACQTSAAASSAKKDDGWIPLIKDNSLDGWTAHGHAKWKIKDGVIIGQSPGGQGHLYAAPVVSNLEIKGKFRITSQGKVGNSGLYFRCNPPKDNIDAFPRGYEAQICNHAKAFTGWLWKPGHPTGPASKLLAKDGEWFSMRARAVGDHITIWVNGTKVTDWHDDEYKKGHFAIQCHNDQMTIEAKDLYYKDLDKDKSDAK